jgi:predicted TPR repeat methyltransferase
MSDSETAKTLFFEALSLLDASNFQAAELKLREAHRLAPDNVSILTNLSIVLAAQDKRDEALKFVEQALAIRPDNIEALLVSADCHTHAHNLNAALAAYDRIVALDPGIAEAHINRGLVLDHLGRHAEALESCGQAIAIDASLSGAHINRGNALHHLKRHDEALAAFDNALALSPDLVEGWIGRCNTLHDLKRYDEALAACDAALARNPALADAWLGRGNALSQLKRYDDAFAAYEKALTLRPDFAEAWLCRGNALSEVRRHEEALAAYDRALEIRPDFAAAWFGRGNVFDDRKQHGAALAAYDRAIALQPDFAGAWLGRGNALRLLKRDRDSVDAYRQALALGGDAGAIRYFLAALGAEPLPAAPPQQFVANLFDSYADTFDKDLTENLRYQVPGVLTDAIKWHLPSEALDIVDLGCGTGLVGEYLRPFKRSLTGIDLSSKMLEKAQERKVYDRLLCCDLDEFLQSQERAFDVAIAADVFVYLGDLSSIFAGIRRTLRDSGLFGFSVERTTGDGFVLRETLRYAHSIGYLRALAQQHRFKLETTVSHVIRRDAGTDIHGYLIVMRCA